jgi:hypothetical protein
MPKGEIEIHPYLQFGEAIPNATRLILGSFPVYYCTEPETPRKVEEKSKGVVPFFYGSRSSKLWKLYQAHVDPTLLLPIVREVAIASLSARGIAMSDTILSAERKEYSASDNDLRNQVWNTDGLRHLLNLGVIKVLCTSKGVLQSLGRRIICPEGNSFGEYLDVEALELQSQFLGNIGGDATTIVEPIAAVYRLNNGSLVAAICIPSPGSAQRSVQHFGYVHGTKADYASRYFERAFKWLQE